MTALPQLPPCLCPRRSPMFHDYDCPKNLHGDPDSAYYRGAAAPSLSHQTENAAAVALAAHITGTPAAQHRPHDYGGVTVCAADGFTWPCPTVDTPMTADEWVAAYAARSDVDPTWLLEAKAARGYVPKPCDCGWVQCEGWVWGYAT